MYRYDETELTNLLAEFDIPAEQNETEIECCTLEYDDEFEGVRL